MGEWEVGLQGLKQPIDVGDALPPTDLDGIGKRHDTPVLRDVGMWVAEQEGVGMGARDGWGGDGRKGQVGRGWLGIGGQAGPVKGGGDEGTEGKKEHA